MECVPDLVVQKIAQLRIRLGDKIQHLEDRDILRFIIAREYDISKTEEMLKNHVRWVETINYDEAHTWIIDPVVQDAFKYCIDGEDKEGRLVAYFPMGKWQGRQMLIAGQAKEVDRELYKMTACANIATSKAKIADKYISILDLADLSYYQVTHYDTVQLIIRMFREQEQNFPEILEAVFLINSPWVLNIIFPLVKPILGRNTIKRMQVYGSSPEKWIPALLERIEVGKLPSMLLENYGDEVKKYCGE